VRLPKARMGVVQRINVFQSETEIGWPVTSEFRTEDYRDAFFRALPELRGTGLVLQSAKGATLTVWDPQTDSYQKKVLWGRDIQQLDEGAEIIYVLGHCWRPGCEGGQGRIRVAVWSRDDALPIRALMLVPKVQELLGLEKFELYLANNPAFWGQGGPVPGIHPAMGVLGLPGLKKVTKGLGSQCDPTYYGVRANCY